MPRVKDEDRIRAKRPKTRTGCSTCKARKVKCDEAKPSCVRCTSTGRRCDGYDEAAAVATFVSAISKAPASWSFLESVQEQRAFDFFQRCSAQELSGYYYSELWSQAILQAAHVDKGIRHAVVALGAFHNNFAGLANSADAGIDFATKQYNLSIQHHLSSLAGGEAYSVDSYVVSCILFVSIEILLGHYASALSLIKSAVQLFYNTSVSNERTSAWPLDLVEALIGRLQAQAHGLGIDPAIVTEPPRLNVSRFDNIPDKFNSLLDAKDYLEFYYHTFSLSRSTENQHGSLENKLRVYEALLQRWTLAFEALVQSFDGSMSKRDRKAIAVLHVRQVGMKLGLQITRNRGAVDNETDYNVSKQLVELAAVVIQPAAGEPRHRSRTAMSLDWSVVGILYDVARRCRDLSIRREAIELLRDNPTLEGLCDSELAARIVERQMELEELVITEMKIARGVLIKCGITSILPTCKARDRCAVVEFEGRFSVLGNGEPFRQTEIITWEMAK